MAGTIKRLLVPYFAALALEAISVRVFARGWLSRNISMKGQIYVHLQNESPYPVSLLAQVCGFGFQGFKGLKYG